MRLEAPKLVMKSDIFSSEKVCLPPNLGVAGGGGEAQVGGGLGESYCDIIPEVNEAKPKKSGTTYKAQFDFSPDSTGYGLSFKKGDVFTVISKDPGGWWEAELNGKKGWVPGNYLVPV